MKKSLFKKKYLFILIAVIIIVLGAVLIAIFNSNYYYSKKLVNAINAQDVAEVRQILDEKPDCINTLPSILPLKIRYGVLDLSRVLYPLNAACLADNIEIVQLLVESGADVNCNDGFTPLSITYSTKQDNWYQISLFLIENGASLDYVTEYSGGESSVLEDIVGVRGGASLPGYIPESETEVIAAFHYALENCDHSKVNWMGVLQRSVSSDRYEIVQFLLDENYCDVNDTLIEMTALMFAARDSTPEMVELLLEKGADKTIMTSEGETAYDFAIQSNNKAIISILENER